MSRPPFTFATIAGPPGHTEATSHLDGSFTCQCGTKLASRGELGKHIAAAVQTSLPIVVEIEIDHGIRMLWDRATDTYALAPREIAIADEQLSDGTLVSIARARTLHTSKNPRDLDEAHKLLFRVHLRALELKTPSVMLEAANVCLEHHDMPALTIPSERLS